MTNLCILFLACMVFPVLIWAALKKPAMGLGLLIFSLPVLNLTRKLFGDSPLPFPSAETMAVLCLWVCIMIRNIVHKESQGMIASKINIAVFVFLCSSLISSLMSRDPVLSLKILFVGGVIPLLCYSIAYRNIKTWNDARYLIYGILGLAIQTGLYSIVNLKRHIAMLGGVADEQFYKEVYNEAPAVNLFVVPSATVATVIISIPLAIWYLHYGVRHRKKICGIVLICVIFTAFFSLSRGSMLGTTIAMLSSLPIYFKRIRISRILLIIGIIIFFYFSGIHNMLLDKVLFRFENTSSGNIDARSANYILSIKSASQYYFAGVGLGQYSDIYNVFRDDVASNMPPLWFAHSLILTLIPEIGLLGAIAFFYIFVNNVVCGFLFFRTKEQEELRMFVYALSVGIISYLIIASTAGSHLVSYLPYDEQFAFFTAPALIVIFSAIGILAAIIKNKTSLFLEKKYSSINE